MWNPLEGIKEWSPKIIELLRQGRESSSGEVVNETTAMNCGAVWTATSLISRTIATLPARVVETVPASSSSPGRRDPRPDHPVSRLMRRPNHWQTRADLVGMLLMHVLLRGNAYVWKNTIRSGRQPEVRELIPMHPDRVEVEQAADNSLTYKLTRKNGIPVPVSPADIIHLRGLSTDGVLGRSPLDDARDTIGVALSTQRAAAEFWEGDGIPAVVLKTPKKFVKPETRDELERSFMDSYGRGKEKKRVAILQEGMDITPLTMSAEDAQFLSTRQFQRGEIGSWFHVPPHMMGDTEKSTSWGTGIEQQTLGFLKFTIGPWLVVLEEAIARNLIEVAATSEDERIALERFRYVHVLAGLLRGDLTSRYNAYWRGVMGGWLSPNDVRRFEDMNPIEGGDIYLAPQNMAPLDMLADIVSDKGISPDVLRGAKDRPLIVPGA